MAESPSHRFGQIIGEVLESAIHPPLEALAKEHGVYLDAKGPRKARQDRHAEPERLTVHLKDKRAVVGPCCCSAPPRVRSTHP